MDLKGLLKTINEAETIDEIKQAKIDFGYAEIVGLVNTESNKKRDEINIKEAKERRSLNIDNRKDLLKKSVGETIHYIGSTWGDLYRNRPCKLLKVNRTKCLVEFSGRDGKWNIPLMELHPNKTNAKEMILTSNGIKII